MNKHEKINYVEFPAKDIEANKAFFSTVFGWYQWMVRLLAHPVMSSSI